MCEDMEWDKILLLALAPRWIHGLAAYFLRLDVLPLLLLVEDVGGNPLRNRGLGWGGHLTSFCPLFIPFQIALCCSDDSLPMSIKQEI